MIRRPASLHAVPRCDGVPALHAGRLCLPLRYYQGAATSRRPSHLASFSFAWRCHRCVLLLCSRGPDERPSRGPGLLWFGQPVPSCVPMETAGSPKFLGEPRLHLRRALRPRQDHWRLTIRDAAARPPWRKRRGLLHCRFRGSIPRLWCSLSTLRPGGLPPRTQDSLPAAGQALPGGLDPQGSNERFQSVLHLILLSQACLAQFHTRGRRRWRCRSGRIRTRDIVPASRGVCAE